MLKRIAIIGDNLELETSLKEAYPAEDILIQLVPDAGNLQAGTAAVIAEEPGAALMEAADAIAAQQETMLVLLADAIGCREGAPLGAEQRVREHATRFAAAMGLSPEDRSALERGALLRDVGKLAIDNSVLLKSNVLDYDEWILIRRHSTLGAQMLQERGIGGDVLDIVRYHHECWDGDGYPENMEGEDIPRLARAMKILDVYCAMTTPRHYRDSTTSHEDAVKHLKSEQGKHYDPELVELFIEHNVGQSAE